jgi:hypothetical protein
MRETFWILVVLFALIVAVMLDDERASEPSRDSGAKGSAVPSACIGRCLKNGGV